MLAAFLLGLVAGLRTFTAPAVLWILRHGGLWGYALGVAALLEYAGDLHPKAASRTAAGPLIARLASGAFCGWAVTAGTGVVPLGILLGACGALAGAYGGLPIRLRAISLVGAVPAGILEDCLAIALAAVVVQRLVHVGGLAV
ncbi:MAG TPA: hypothetical protein VEW74_01515 [Candidatus Nitrosotalea sp.]|nr:hypothetical protein [Candidatus Nitrosotalea sp.]